MRGRRRCLLFIPLVASGVVSFVYSAYLAAFVPPEYNPDMLLWCCSLPALGQDGVTAAKMLSFKRDLCPELSSSAAPPSTGVTTTGLKTVPSQPRPPVTPRVTNPYTSGFRNVPSNPHHASTATTRPLPASPFAVAAAAAAAKRAKVAATASATNKAVTVPTLAVVRHVQHNTPRAAPARPGAPASVPAPPLASPRGHLGMLAGSGRARPHEAAGNEISGPSASPSVGINPPKTSCASTTARSAQTSELPLRVASSLDTDAAGQHRTGLRNDAEAGGEVISSLPPIIGGNGFPTASGTPVAVTAEALAKVEYLFRDDSAATSNRRTANAAAGSASVGAVVVAASKPPTSNFSGEVPGDGEDRRGLQEAATAGGGTINRDVVANVAEGRSAAGGSSMGFKNTASSDMGAPLSSDSGPRGFAGFQTGRGRTLSVSSEALAKVQHLFRDDNASEAMSSASSALKPATTQRPRRKISDVVSRSPVAAKAGGIPLERNRTMGAGGFKRPTAISKPGGRSREAGFQAAAPQLGVQRGGGNVRKSEGGLDGRAMPAPALSSEAVFQTAGGKELHVSEEAIARVSHIFSDAMPTDDRFSPATSVSSVEGGRGHPSGAAGTTTATTTSSITVSASLGGGESLSRPALPRRGGEKKSKHDDARGDGEMNKAGVSSIAPAKHEGGEGQLNNVSWDAEASSCLPTTGGNAFQTARGRALPVSAEALAKVSHLFQEANAGNGTRASGSGKDTSSVDRLENSSTSLGRMNSSRHDGARGSQTARGRKLSVSAKTVAGASRSLESAESGEVHGGLKGSGTAAPQRGVTGPTRGLVRPIGGCPEASPASSVATGEFSTGFKTGRGRSLNVTSEALEKTKRFFAEEGPEVERGKAGRYRKDALGIHHDAFAVGGASRATERQGGIRGASGGMTPSVSPMSGIKRSDDASGGYKLDASSSTDSRDPDDNVPVSAAALGSGFCTGKGAPVHVSAEALKKVKQFLSGAGDFDVRDEAQEDGEVPPPPHARESANNVMPTRGDGTGSGASVFSTAKGRVIEVSAEALAKAKHMFRETEPPGGKSMSRGQRPAVDKAEVARIGGGSGGSRDDSSIFSAEMSGATGSSCDALARERKLFEDVGPCSEPGKTMPPPTAGLSAGVGDGGVGSTSSGKLSTETGGNLAVVAEGVEHVPGKMRGRAECVEPAAGEAPFLVGAGEGVGGGNSLSAFSTGAGRTIKVSEEALVQAQRKYGEMRSCTDQLKRAPSIIVSGGGGGGEIGETEPSTEPATRPPGGAESSVSAFSTGAGRAIDVSAEALALAQKRFGDLGSSAGPVESSSGPALGGGNVASVFSTGRGRAVEVSAAALAQANKLFGDGGVAGGGSNGGGTRQATVGGREGITPRRQAARAQAQPQESRELPSRDGRLPSAVGKENGKGGHPKHVLGTPARSTGVTNGIAARGRYWGVSTPNHETRSGQKSTRGGPSSFSSPSRRRIMPPPAGTATPSSGGKPLCRTTNSADAASIAPPVGRGTPLSAKRRGLGYGGGGLHAMKRPRSTSKAGTPGASRRASPHASPHGPRSGGRRVVPRPSLTRPSSVLATTASPSSISSKAVGGGDGKGDSMGVLENGRVAQGEPGCGTSRVLFDSTNAAAAESVAGGEGKLRRHNHRRPLSSLLNVPTQVVESLRPCDVENNDAGFTEKEAVGVEEDGGGEKRMAAPPLLPKEAAREEGATVAARPSTGEARREVVALLLRVTARNAIDMRFCADGTPCCLGATPASPELASATVGDGSRGPGAATAVGVTGTVTSSGVSTCYLAQGEQRCEPCRGGEHHYQASESAVNDFRDELVRSGKDGELATPTWAKNHYR